MRAGGSVGVAGAPSVVGGGASARMIPGGGVNGIFAGGAFIVFGAPTGLRGESPTGASALPAASEAESPAATTTFEAATTSWSMPSQRNFLPGSGSTYRGTGLPANFCARHGPASWTTTWPCVPYETRLRRAHLRCQQPTKRNRQRPQHLELRAQLRCNRQIAAVVAAVQLEECNKEELGNQLEEEENGE